MSKKCRQVEAEEMSKKGNIRMVHFHAYTLSMLIGISLLRLSQNSWGHTACRTEHLCFWLADVHHTYAGEKTPEDLSLNLGKPVLFPLF